MSLFLDELLIKHHQKIIIKTRQQLCKPTRSTIKWIKVIDNFKVEISRRCKQGLIKTELTIEDIFSGANFLCPNSTNQKFNVVKDVVPEILILELL